MLTNADNAVYGKLPIILALEYWLLMNWLLLKKVVYKILKFYYSTIEKLCIFTATAIYARIKSEQYKKLNEIKSSKVFVNRHNMWVCLVCAHVCVCVYSLITDQVSAKYQWKILKKQVGTSLQSALECSFCIAFIRLFKELREYFVTLNL